jgi:hypothetical protein
MKKTFTLLMLGALTLTLLAFAFITVQAKSEDKPLLQTTATPAPSIDDGAQDASGDIVVWDQFCVRKVPYTLIAMPKDASFEVVQPEGVLPTPIISTGNSNEIACESVGIFRDRQVVVCRGPQLYSFTLQVAGEDFTVPLKACPGPQQPSN